MQDATGRVPAVKSAGMMTRELRRTSKTIAAAKGSPGLKEAATELLEEHATTSAQKVTSNHSDKTPQVPTTVRISFKLSNCHVALAKQRNVYPGISPFGQG